MAEASDYQPQIFRARWTRGWVMTLSGFSELSTPQRAFYQAILRSFAASAGPPDSTWLETTATSFALDAETTLNQLADLDLLVLDPVTGVIQSLYPFSALPTRHVVHLAGGTQVSAMCAVDALGIPFMLGQDAVIASVDPMTDEPIQVTVQDGTATWEPATTVVLTVSLEQIVGTKAETCCPLMNFFASAANAEAYRDRQCQVAGVLLNQEEALERSKRGFGELLAAGASRSAEMSS
jgi:hypothetical protein